MWFQSHDTTNISQMSLMKLKGSCLALGSSNLLIHRLNPSPSGPPPSRPSTHESPFLALPKLPDKLLPQTKSAFSSTSSTKSPFPSKPTPCNRNTHHLTHQELQDLRAKGLYFKCKQPFSNANNLFPLFTNVLIYHFTWRL